MRVVGEFAEVLCGDEIAGFDECVLEFAAGDTDVREIAFALCYLRASEDEAPVSVVRDKAFGISFGEETVFAFLDVISEAFSERSGEGFALF